MKVLCSLLTIAFACNAFTQNVGINNKLPRETVSPTINVNSMDGLQNQPIKNGAVLPSLATTSEFKNMANFTTSTTWTVPANVTRIGVDVWGAGGGGNSLAGGGGGGFVRGILPVKAGNTVSITIGEGGSGSGIGMLGSAGENSSVSVEGIILSGLGGGPAVLRGSDATFAGNPGTYHAGTFKNFTFQLGDPGQPCKLDFLHAGSSVVYEVNTGGNGGDAGNAPGTGGKGVYSINVLSSTPSSKRFVYGTNGKVPGGGGGSGYKLEDGETSSSGFRGGNGMVIIYY